MRSTYKKFSNKKDKALNRRKLSIRKKVIGTAERPRLCVIRSNKNISVQVVDDSVGKTLFSLHTFGKKQSNELKGNIEGAKKLGELVAEKLKANKIDRVVFDRNGRKYFGVLAALADSVRSCDINI